MWSKAGCSGLGAEQASTMTKRSNPRCGPDPRTGPQRDVGPITEVEVVAVDQAPDRSVALLAREAFGVQDPGPCEGHERDFAASAQPQR